MDIRHRFVALGGPTLALRVGVVGLIVAIAMPAQGQRFGRGDSGGRSSRSQSASTRNSDSRAARQGGSSRSAAAAPSVRATPRSDSPAVQPRSYSPRATDTTRSGANLSENRYRTRAYSPPSAGIAGAPGAASNARAREGLRTPTVRSSPIERPRLAASPGESGPSTLRGLSLPTARPADSAADRPSISDIRRRIPDSGSSRAGLTLAGESRFASGDSGRRAPSSAADGARSSGDRVQMSDLRKRIPDVPALKADDATAQRRVAAGDSPRGDRAGKFDAGKSGAGKSDTGKSSAGKFDAGKSSAGKFEAGKSSAGKFDAGKSSAGKSSPDRPKISDLRKRIPDVSDGKLKPSDARGKAGDFSRPPGMKQIDGGKIPDVGGKTGKKTSLDIKPGVKDAKPRMKITSPEGPGMGKPLGAADALARTRFPDRVKKGEFDALTRSAVGQKIKLADQYRLAQQGDVARRLALHKPGINVAHAPRGTSLAHAKGAFHPHPDFRHHGWVSPVYHRHCFEYRSWFGPGWYPSIWWYPRWHPWVHWSWYHRCHPFWDPRPIWCRPIAYVVVGRPWMYWDYPVWTPLPVVTSGTWVEVQRPVVHEAQYDLQLLAVRFVDPGHPDEKLGPRFRVWFRNNSNQAIGQGFDVRLFATADATLAGSAPQAGVRVTAIEAGDTQSVDIRLPFEVAQAPADPQGKPPFQYVHAMVDANREIQDVDRANNGARVATAEVLPVDPAAFETDPTTVAAGGELIVAGEGFGPEPGKVILHLGNIEMDAEVLGWYDLGVRLKMPDLPLAGATKADLVVIRGDGAAANPLSVTVNPPQRNATAPEINAPALPPVPDPPKPAPVK